MISDLEATLLVWVADEKILILSIYFSDGRTELKNRQNQWCCGGAPNWYYSFKAWGFESK